MDVIALFGVLEFRRLVEGSAPVAASLWLSTLRAEPSLASCVFLPLFSVRGIMALATALFAVVIVAINSNRRLTFPATWRALRGWPSFRIGELPVLAVGEHALLSISVSTSFMSGSYTEPFKLLRKYNVEKGDAELSRQIVKK